MDIHNIYNIRKNKHKHNSKHTNGTSIEIHIIYKHEAKYNNEHLQNNKRYVKIENKHNNKHTDKLIDKYTETSS